MRLLAALAAEVGAVKPEKTSLCAQTVRGVSFGAEHAFCTASFKTGGAEEARPHCLGSENTVYRLCCGKQGWKGAACGA